jgi:hypothetical protein
MSVEQVANVENQAEETVAEPEGKGERERSTIEFPYLDLNDAVEVAQKVHAAGGTSCRIEQLAGELKLQATGGGFRLRLQTARIFGLVAYDRATVTLTITGQKVCDPKQAAAGKAEAFLSVPLYERIYEQFKGIVLPGNAGLENAMGSLGVAPKQKAKARQVFQRSAQQAEFFAHGAERLVFPSLKAGAAADHNAQPKGEKLNKEANGGSNSGGGGPYDPLISGLLNRLPPVDSAWPMVERRKWLQTAAMNFEMLYRDPDESGAVIRVDLKKDSAE